MNLHKYLIQAVGGLWFVFYVFLYKVSANTNNISIVALVASVLTVCAIWVYLQKGSYE